MGMTAASALAGNITFNPPQNRINPGVHLEVAGSKMSFADYDHDGDIDWLAGIDYQGILYVFNNRGLDANGYLSAARSQIDWFIDDAEFADVNGDGWADIITASRGQGFRIRLNNQSGGFTLNQTILGSDFTPNQQEWHFAVGDVENDGFGNFTEAWTGGARYPNTTSHVFFADGDGNGSTDLLTFGQYGSTYHGNGTIIDPDSDGDGVPDSEDAFPNDASETTDTDGDGVGDNGDAFPNDASESADSDGDGTGDNADVFPNDATETTDSDGDGVGDNGDAFPNDASESADSDGDGTGNNADAFPNDAAETTDTDGDGVGDNGDAFPNDASESADSDGDGTGDNSDPFPNDATESSDSDGDGLGDNSDPFPISDQSPTVIIGGVDSGVANRPFAPGATLADFLTATLADCAIDAKNHGKVVSCFSKLLNELKKNDIITKKEKGALQKTVSRKSGSSKGSGYSSGKSGKSGGSSKSGSSAKGGAPAPKKSKGKKGKK
jgi:hypothetical protein